MSDLWGGRQSVWAHFPDSRCCKVIHAFSTRAGGRRRAERARTRRGAAAARAGESRGEPCAALAPCGRVSACSARVISADTSHGQCNTCRPRPHIARRSPRAALRRAARAASPLCRTTRPLGASRGPRARPASLLLLAAWLAAVAGAADLACPQDPPAAQVMCASCRSYENAREYSLRVIRESLLAKLGFAQAPNTTGRQLPRVPADLMKRFERRPPPAGVQADAPALSRTFVTHTEQDDFLARTDNVLIFAR